MSTPATPTLLELISGELQRVEEALQDVQDVGYEPLALVLREMLRAGGKRLRPAVAILATRFHGSEPEKVTLLAASVETLHTATLVHDDVIDNSLLRRGRPTLNARWSQGATILAGDYLFARAADFAARTDNVRVVRIFAHTLMVICDGELREIFGSRDWAQIRSDYERRISAKTASLFAAAAEAGAVLSGAPEPEVQALRHYGQRLGMAFQMVDDILDFSGRRERLGKPVGHDLHQGVITLPVICYSQITDGHPLLEEIAAGNGVAEAAVRELVEEIRSSPAIPTAMEEARQQSQAALAALEPLPHGETRDALEEVARYVVEREV